MGIPTVQPSILLLVASLPHCLIAGFEKVKGWLLRCEVVVLARQPPAGAASCAPPVALCFVASMPMLMFAGVD